jgi:diaminopimelate decarboxylase
MSEVAVEQLKFLAPDDVRTVAEEFGTPVFVYDEATVRASSTPSA